MKKGIANVLLLLLFIISETGMVLLSNNSFYYLTLGCLISSRKLKKKNFTHIQWREQVQQYLQITERGSRQFDLQL